MATKKRKKKGNQKPTMRFAAIERVSTEKQETGTSLDRQQEANEKDAKEIAKGFGKNSKVEHFRGSESGAEHRDHPMVESVIVRCERGEFDAVIVQAVDRFARDDLQIRAWLRRLERVRVYAFEKTSRLREKDIGTRVKATVAGGERNDIIERTWEGRKRRQREGNSHVIGKPPVGYRFNENKKLFVVDRVHKNLIRKALRKYLTTDIGFEVLAEEVGPEWKKKFPKKYRHVSAHTLQRILEDTAARTEWSVTAKVKDPEWDEDVVDKDGNPVREVLCTFDLTKGGGPIITKEEAAAVKKKARLKPSIANRKNSRVYPLVGVLICDHCKGAMRGTGNKGFYYYKHIDEERRQKDNGCAPNIRADKLERIVFGWVERIITGRYPLKQAIENEIRTRDKTLKSLEQEEADLAETVKHIDDKYQAALDLAYTVRGEKAKQDLAKRIDRLAEQLEAKQQTLEEVRERLDAIRKPVDETVLAKAEELLARSFGKRKLNQLDAKSKRKIIRWLIGVDDATECREKGLGIYLRPGEIVIKGRLGLIQVDVSGRVTLLPKRRVKRVQPCVEPNLAGLAELLLELDSKKFARKQFDLHQRHGGFS